MDVLEREPRRVVATVYTLLLDSFMFDAKARTEFLMLMAWPEERAALEQGIAREVAEANESAFGALDRMLGD